MSECQRKSSYVSQRAHHDGAFAQLRDVRKIMQDGRWRTLSEISEHCWPASEASVSARLRDLRKVKFGGHTVDRRYVGEGIWEYRVKLNAQAAA